MTLIVQAQQYTLRLLVYGFVGIVTRTNTRYIHIWQL